MAQLVEQRIRNAWVTSSSLVIGSSFFINNHLCFIAELAQLVEHWLPKPRVAGSSPVIRSFFISPEKSHGIFLSTEHTDHTEKIIVKDVVQDSSLDFEP